MSEELSYERIESIQRIVDKSSSVKYQLIDEDELRELCRLALIGKKEEHFRVERAKIISELFKESLSNEN